MFYHRYLNDVEMPLCYIYVRCVVELKASTSGPCLDFSVLGREMIAVRKQKREKDEDG